MNHSPFSLCAASLGGKFPSARTTWSASSLLPDLPINWNDKGSRVARRWPSGESEHLLSHPSAPDFDQVISIPDSQLYKGHKIVLPVDSLEVGIDEYFINSALLRPDQLPSSNYPHLQIGPMAVSVQTERTYKENERNMPTAAVSVWQGGKPVGSWSLASGFPRPVNFQAGGKNYQIVLRPKRFYKPFAIQLVQFSHDRYAGTDIAKNFSSRIRLLDPSLHED